jgi:hypothetical protein
VAGNVRSVHVVPSGLVAHLLVLPAMAQKTVPFQAMLSHAREAGRVRVVQVMPSGLVAHEVVPDATAQKTDPFQATPRQLSLDGIGI